MWITEWHTSHASDASTDSQRLDSRLFSGSQNQAVTSLTRTHLTAHTHTHTHTS